MVNQQLVDWIKNEEAQGYTLRQLYNSLIQQGYNPDEVSEAINIASQPNQQVNPSSKPIKKSFHLLPILIIGVVVIGLIGGYIFFFTSQNNKNTNSDTTVKDCGEDFSCFVSASESCSDAKVNHIIETNILGVVQKTNNSYELKKLSNGTCSFSLVTNNIDLQYSQKLLDMAKRGGATQDQIDQQLQLTKSQYDILIDKKGTCKGDMGIISSLLKRWQEGSFSSSDWNNLECSGPYFDQMNRNVQGSISQKNGSTRINISMNLSMGDTSKGECMFSEDCKEGFHCMNKECVNNSILNTFSDCVNNECKETCTNCENGVYTCMMSSESFENNKCVECFIDSQCNEGYGCKAYKCVKKSQ